MRVVSLASMGVVAVVLAASVSAQDRLEVNSGRVYEGRIVSDDGTTVEIETRQGATMKLPYAQLTPMTQYRLRRGRTGEDGEGLLELAEWCVDETLYKEARLHYRAALEADMFLEEKINKSVVSARTRAANELLERAKGLRESGKPKEARRHLSTIVQELPLEDAADEAARLLAEETEQRKQSSLSHDRAPAGDTPTDRATRRSGEPFSDDAYKTMSKVIDAYKKLLDHTQRGLEASKEGTSINEYKRGLSEGDKGRKAVDRVRRKANGNDEIAEAIELAEGKLEEAIVDCRVFLVNAYLLRSSYKQAGDVVKKGFAAYPKNTRLRRANEQVVAAANNNDGGGWSIRGGGGRFQPVGRRR